jgi:hypothetical protein
MNKLVLVLFYTEWLSVMSQKKKTVLFLRVGLRNEASESRSINKSRSAKS